MTKPQTRQLKKKSSFNWIYSFRGLDFAIIEKCHGKREYPRTYTWCSRRKHSVHSKCSGSFETLKPRKSYVRHHLTKPNYPTNAQKFSQLEAFSSNIYVNEDCFPSIHHKKYLPILYLLLCAAQRKISNKMFLVILFWVNSICSQIFCFFST